MARVRANLSKVRTSSTRPRGCVKPKCKTGSRSLNRHHVRHQGMWLGVWAGRRRGEPRWIEFVKRYWSFHRDDVRYLCANHHAEIHSIYDDIIAEDRAKVGKPLYDYSWKQAEALMDKLEAAFNVWIRLESRGISSKNYGKTKKARRQKAYEKYLDS